MATIELVNALKTELESILKYSDAQLISRSDWGTINFKNARTDIEAASSMSRDLNGLPLEELTDETINRIQGIIPAVAQILDEIDNFSLIGSPEVNRDDICNRLRGAVDQLRDSAIIYIPYLMYKRGDVGENISKLEQAVASAKKQYDDGEKIYHRKKGRNRED